jgi:hypothetical protein
MLLKNAITQTAGTILNRMERVTYQDWFDAECEQATISKTKHTKGCNKEILLGKQWRNIEPSEEKKKEYVNKRRR